MCKLTLHNEYYAMTHHFVWRIYRSRSLQFLANLTCPCVVNIRLQMYIGRRCPSSFAAEYYTDDQSRWSWASTSLSFVFRGAWTHFNFYRTQVWSLQCWLIVLLGRCWWVVVFNKIAMEEEEGQLISFHITWLEAPAHPALGHGHLQWRYVNECECIFR